MNLWDFASLFGICVSGWSLSSIINQSEVSPIQGMWSQERSFPSRIPSPRICDAWQHTSHWSSCRSSCQWRMWFLHWTLAYFVSVEFWRLFVSWWSRPQHPQIAFYKWSLKERIPYLVGACWWFAFTFLAGWWCETCGHWQSDWARNAHSSARTSQQVRFCMFKTRHSSQTLFL